MQGKCNSKCMVSVLLLAAYACCSTFWHFCLYLEMLFSMQTLRGMRVAMGDLFTLDLYMPWGILPLSVRLNYLDHRR